MYLLFVYASEICSRRDNFNQTMPDPSDVPDVKQFLWEI